MSKNKIKNLMKFMAMALIVLSGGIFGAPNTEAAIRDTLNFQGKVQNSDGTNVADGAYDFVFKIYQANVLKWTESWTSAALFTETGAVAFTNDGCASGIDSVVYTTDTGELTLAAGQQLWNITKEESAMIYSVVTGTNTICVYDTVSATWDTTDDITNRIYVKDGIFSLELNSLQADWSAVDFSSDDLWLGVNFNADGEMKPRKRLTAVPYARNALNVVGDGYVAVDSNRAGAVVNVIQAGVGNSVSIDQNGNVGAALSTDGALFVENTGNTGIGFNVYTDIGATAVASLAYLTANNIAFNQEVLTVLQNGTGSIVSFTNTAAATSAAFTISNLGSGNSFVVNDVTGDTTPFVIDKDGYVGIGITVPTVPLHVAGQCVTGDTVLPIVRESPKSKVQSIPNQIQNPNDKSFDNKKSAEMTDPLEFQNDSNSSDLTSKNSISYQNSLSSGNKGNFFGGGSAGNRTPETLMSSQSSSHSGPTADSLYQNIEYIAIKDVKPGMEVLSLNEETGELAPARINGLMDMGVKPIYKLTTESGKNIRTTENHPYLAIKSQIPNPKSQTNSKPQIQNSKQANPYHLIEKYELGETKTIWQEGEQNKNTFMNEDAFANSFNGNGIPSIDTRYLQYSISENLVKSGQWVKVRELREGQMIAVVHGDKVVWEKIVEIKQLPAERVYDIEVQGTHNFVANGIVAHNTYINTNNAAALKVENSAGNTNVLVVDTANGRVGIGTAAPTNLLSLGGDSARTFWMERHTAINTAGNNLTIQSGGATRLMVSTISITAGGTGYAVNDVLTLAAPTGGVSATVTVTSVAAGVVDGVSLTTKGSNYTTGTKTTTVAPAGGTGCTINVLTLESATDKAGGDLYLASGMSTGTGASNLYFQTVAAGTTSATDNTLSTKLTILGSGNVGIGTTSPSAKLDIVALDADNAVGLEINQQDTSSAVAATIVNAGTGNGLYIDQNGNGIALNIDSASTGTYTVNIDSATNQNILRITPTGVLSAGYSAINIYTNAVMNGGGNLLELYSDSGSSTDNIQKIYNDGTGNGIFIDQNGNAVALNIDTEITTANGITVAADVLTTGYGASISSTSGALTTGRLLSLDWSPTSATATGDLFNINIGSGGTAGNLLNITDNGSSLFSVSETAITSNLPHSFTSAGDVSMAYDLIFINPTASYIKSSAPLYLEAGESFASSNLTLKTYNQGSVVVDSSVTTGTALNVINSTLTTGNGIRFTGPTSTGITGNAVSISSAIGSAGKLVNLAPDFTGSAVTGYGIYQAATDSTATANTDYGYYSSLTLTGDAAKTGTGIYSTVSSASTTADTLASLDLATSATGVITSGTRTIYGLRSQPASTAASSGTQALNLYGSYLNPSSTLAIAGATNVYGQYITSTATHNADAGTVNQYGLYVANGTSSTNGTATKYGLYVESPTGADTNYAAIFAGGNVGIGTATPAALLSVGATSQFQVSSAGAITAVGVNSGSGLITGTGGLTITGAANINAAGTAITNIGNSTGILTLASGGVSSWTNTANNLTIQTATSGILALTSAGALNLTGAVASAWSIGTGNALTLTSQNFRVDSAGNITVVAGQGLDAIAAGILNFGNTTATTVNVGNTAAVTLAIGAGGALTRTINIGTGTGADTISIGTGGGSDIIAIGGGAGTLAVNTGDWDISTTGVMTGISGITTNGGYTQSGTDANAFTGTSTFSNATYSALFTSGNVGIGTVSPSSKLHIAQSGSSIEILRPNAVGDEENIAVGTGGTGLHWSAVDEETPDNLVTNVSNNNDAVNYQRDLYNIPNHSAGSGAINFIKVYTHVFSYPGGNSVKIAIKSGIGTGAPTTASESAEISPTPNTWETHSNQWDTNPATGQAFTWAEIDNLQIGVSLKKVGGYTTYSTQVYIEVDYTSPTMIVTGGLVGIGTTAPDKTLEINAATGGSLRLTYNDSDGSAANYNDFLVGSSGDLTIIASGGDISLDNENLATTGTITSGLINSQTISSAANFTGTGAFASTLTASNGLTLTTGALNLTATSGVLALSGLSTSSISTGANGLTFVSGGTSSWANTSGNLTISTVTSGTLALTSAGALNLSAAAASTWTLPAVANALNFDSNTLSIDASGNMVGIGTAAPSAKLTVRSDSTGAVVSLLRMENLDTAAIGTGGSVDFYAMRTTSGTTQFTSLESVVTSADATYWSGKLNMKVASNGELVTMMEIGNPNIVLNRPLEVNVAGDTGISYDLAFLSTGNSNITSYGPLTIAAGDPNHAKNLTLTTQSNQATGDSGVATGATATTLTDSTKSALWVADAWIGGSISIISGTGSGQTQTITTNTTTAITVADWDTALGDPAVNSVYQLSYAKGGDVLVAIQNSDLLYGGFKVSGGDNGGYVFRVSASGNVEIGGNGAGPGNLVVKQNLSLTGGNITVNKLSTPTNGVAACTTVTAGGLVDGTYYYRVSAINNNGETLAMAEFNSPACAATGVLNSVTVTWDAVAGATAYKVYGRTTGTELYMKTVSAPNLIFVDNDSTLTPLGALPASNTTGGKIAINTTINGTSDRGLETLDSGNPQMRLTQSNDIDYADFQVDGAGDLTITMSGDDLIIDDNLQVCSGACPTTGYTIAGTGNLVVENKVVADSFERICAAGYIWVPGSAKFGTMPGFCAMKYEAKGTTGAVVSTATGSPYVSISQESARAECQGIGTGYHLISENEWMTIAENIANTTINDLESTAGLQLATGQSANTPASALATTDGAEPVVTGCTLTAPLSSNAYTGTCQLRGTTGGGDNDKGYYGTGQTYTEVYTSGADNDAQLRTFVLSNGNVIWDVAGNVWEWTDAISLCREHPVSDYNEEDRADTPTVSFAGSVPNTTLTTTIHQFQVASSRTLTRADFYSITAYADGDATDYCRIHIYNSTDAVDVLTFGITSASKTGSWTGTGALVAGKNYQVQVEIKADDATAATIAPANGNISMDAIPAPTSNWFQYTEIDDYKAMSYVRPPDDGWSSTNGIGRIYTDAGDTPTSTRAFLRGGNWNNTSYAGVFALALDGSPASTYTTVGFRCAR